MVQTTGLDKELCLEWCKKHEFALSKHRRSFVAICLKRGILFSAISEKEFARIFCETIPKDQRHLVFVTHTSELEFFDDYTSKEMYNFRREIEATSVNRSKQPINIWVKKKQRKNNV